jgi:peptidyl-dipeptidase Dcp
MTSPAQKDDIPGQTPVKPKFSYLHGIINQIIMYMKIKYIGLIIPIFLITSCTMNSKKTDHTDNPFFSEFNTPYEVPDFSRIKNEHFLPAFKEGIERQKQEIEAIVSNTEAPDFANTIEALDYSGEMLSTVRMVFYNLTSANTGEVIQQIAREVSPLMTEHYDNMRLNPELFARVKAVYDMSGDLDLSTEQSRLLEETYKQFARGGANLPEERQEQLREINKELSLLSLRFGDNLLAETNVFKLLLEEEELAGLPPFVRDAAAAAAKEEGLEGKWLITLHTPSRIPFLQFSERRDLREKVFNAYINRGNNGNEHDNKEILARMASLRVKKANLLGYPTHAAFVLEENMAKDPQTVYRFLDEIWQAALPVAKAEASDMQAMIETEGGEFKLQPWDWWYYAEKIRKQKYDLDEAEMKPYFVLENVVDGMFGVANKLFGITFTERDDIPEYHPEVHTYEVKEANGDFIGILMMDFFPRASKEGGAWMSSYRDQYRHHGEEVTPIITMVMNFTKPTSDKPSLLTFDEVRTMFHEFGHALHGMLSNTTYPRLSGTEVPRDFVELPSQIMENWAAEPKVMKTFARHYETGEVIPQELIDKLEASKYFNQGFATVEYMSACFLDMDWHTLTDTALQDPMAFETASMERIGLIPEIVVRYRSPYFAHIFAGGYSSGYYSYIWAEVLDADAFAYFREKGIFDEATASSFRENVLSRGGTDDPMKLYVNFRGKEPDVKPMLERKGLLEDF